MPGTTLVSLNYYALNLVRFYYNNFNLLEIDHEVAKEARRYSRVLGVTLRGMQRSPAVLDWAVGGFYRRTFTMIFIGIVTGLLLIVLINCWITRWSKERSATINQTEWIIWTSVLLGIVVLIWVVSYLVAIGAYGDLVAYKQVKEEYSLAITQTSNTLQNSVSIGILGLAYNNHSIQVAKRIKERRDKAEWYYECRERIKINLSRWFTRQFMPKPPDGLLN